MTDVFISYARADFELAQDVTARLTNANFAVWWDHQLLAGDQFRRQIAQKLDEARHVIVIWTDNSIVSPWVLDEADQAQRQRKLISVCADTFDMTRIPIGFRQSQALRISNWERITASLRGSAPTQVSPSKGEDVLERLRGAGIKFLNAYYSDLRGRQRHVSIDVSQVSKAIFDEGIVINPSTAPSWTMREGTPLVLLPDPRTYFQEPLSREPVASLLCDVLVAHTGNPFELDPRACTQKAEAYLKTTGIADTARLRASIEFCAVQGDEPGRFTINHTANMAAIRRELANILARVGISLEGHHDDGTAYSAIGPQADTLCRAADKTQICKTLIMQKSTGGSTRLSFLPKPVQWEKANGMGVEISLWRNEIPIFSGSSYGGLSEQSLHFIGGILKHAKTLNAFGNQSTNSYRRLYPPNPILCAYSSTQENTVCRVPFATSPNAKRVEVRFADPLANPYLLFPALLMAGIDGIMNRIDPGAPVERNLYDVSPSELAKVPVVSESLREALTNLDNNREFLKKGEVFTDEIIDAYIELKMSEYYAVFQAPHPVELQLASEYAG